MRFTVFAVSTFAALVLASSSATHPTPATGAATPAVGTVSADPHKAYKKYVKGKKHHRYAREVSARSPMHPALVGERSLTSPQGVANSILSLCGVLGADKGNIHNSLLLLKGDKSLASSTSYHKQVAKQLAEWQKHAATIPTLDQVHNSLAYFGREKGMANLNKKSDLEVALKNIINFIKYTLSDVNLIVYEIPVLGSSLGPIVYQIKCIVDDVLNGSENTVDGLLNQLGLATLIQLDVCGLVPSLAAYC